MIALALTACTSKSGEITVHPLLCDGSVQNGKCSGKWLSLNATVYRVSEDRQSVIYWTPAIFDTPMKLANCVVRNVKNWQCTYQDKSAILIMNAGRFTVEVNNQMVSATTKQNEMRTRYVGWFQYWKYQLTGVLD
jgi:hypothetical protein